MDLCDKNIIKHILKKNRLWARKSLGQHFLISQKVLDKIMQSAKLSDNDTVLEIGPGIGVLTQKLAKKAKLVLGIEKDYKLTEWLRRYFKSNKNVKIIHEDILKFPISKLQFPNKFQNSKKENSKQYNNRTIEQWSNYKVVANIPYQITSPVIRKFLSAKNKPKEMVLMVQKEVAERICAKPGSSKRGFLTVLVEFYAKNIEIVEIVKKDCFWPKPKVDSAVIKLTIKQFNNLTIDSETFFRLVKVGFSQKRRQIHNPLKSGLHLGKDQIFKILKKAGIDPTTRAEDLSLKNWEKLYKHI